MCLGQIEQKLPICPIRGNLGEIQFSIFDVAIITYHHAQIKNSKNRSLDAGVTNIPT